MAQTSVPWLLYGLLRLVLGLFGVAAGLALGALFLLFWHCISWGVLAMFGLHVGDWIFAWDAFFAVVLFREGYRYQARMPPRGVFESAAPMITRSVAEVQVVKVEQTAFAISEILYVAPRFLFWGIGHLRRIVWPSPQLGPTVERIYSAVRPAKQGIPYDEVLGMGRTQDEAIHALALLAKAELVQPLHHGDLLYVQASEPDWI